MPVKNYLLKSENLQLVSRKRKKLDAVKVKVQETTVCLFIHLAILLQVVLMVLIMSPKRPSFKIMVFG